MQKAEYDRMNPDSRLFSILREYSKITYGKEAYSLSSKEAEFILNELTILTDIICSAQTIMSRPQKAMLDKLDAEITRIRDATK